MIDGGMGALADAIRIAVRDETSLKNRLNDVAQRVVYHAVAKWRGADAAALGVMIILTRTFDLLAWLLPKAKDFPKLYHSTVTQRMMTIALEFQEALYDAQAQGGSTRLKHLRTADGHLNKLRLYLRLAHYWHWLNEGQYRHASGMVAEIGRLLGGWIATSS